MRRGHGFGATAASPSASKGTSPAIRRPVRSTHRQRSSPRPAGGRSVSRRRSASARNWCNSARRCRRRNAGRKRRSEENTSELQSLMRRSYAVLCLKKKKNKKKRKVKTQKRQRIKSKGHISIDV